MNREWNLKGLKVHIGIPAYGDLAPQTALSLCGTLLTLAKEGIDFALSIKYGNCYVDQCRSIIAQEFLDGQADYLFHIDSDMVWEPRDFLQVLAHTTVHDCVSVAYLMKDENIEKYTVAIPKTTEVDDYGCIPMDGGGLGFVCTQRKVIEELARRAEKIKMGNRPSVPWIYRIRAKEGCYQGEDMVFFEDMRDAGFKAFLDTGLILGHLGRKEYRGSLLNSLLDQAEGLAVGWKFPKDVAGWLTESEAKTLARLARGKTVVEMGSYCGRSTIAMAQLATSVDSIDWHHGDEMSGSGGTLENLRYNLAQYRVEERVRVHKGRTEDVAPTLPSKVFDLAFIDAAHDEKNVRIDVSQALRLVKPGGTIAFHDFCIADVERVAKEMLGNPVGYVDSIAWFQIP